MSGSRELDIILIYWHKIEHHFIFAETPNFKENSIFCYLKFNFINDDSDLFDFVRDMTSNVSHDCFRSQKITFTNLINRIFCYLKLNFINDDNDVFDLVRDMTCNVSHDCFRSQKITFINLINQDTTCRIVNNICTIDLIYDLHNTVL